MGWFVMGLVFFVLGILVYLGAAWYGRTTPGKSDETKGGKAVAWILAGIGIFVIVLNSYTVVPARNVSIPVVLGSPRDALNNGPHWVEPWSNIETIDATVQNINLNADLGQWEHGVCTTIAVRLQNQTTACLDLTGQWNIDHAAHTSELWQKYRGTNDDVVANVGNNVVRRELQRAANVAFEKYNPLGVLNGQTVANPLTTKELSDAILADMRQSVDAGIVVDKLLISIVHYDTTTQSKLNAYAQALADTQIATQAKLTAEQQKLANDILAQASSSDPGVMYQNCINLIRDLAAKGQLQNLPATFTCGSSGQTPVIVGQR